MAVLARRAAADIERRLHGFTSATDRVLLQRFAREQGDPKTPVVLINGDMMRANAAGEQMLGGIHRGELWDYVMSALADGPVPKSFTSANGTLMTLHCEPVLDGGIVVGAAVHLSAPVVGEEALSAGQQAVRPLLGLDALTSAERGVADLVSHGMTNRQVADQLFISPYTVDSHLRSIFRKLDVNSRVDLTRLILIDRRDTTA
jgi:DNA-binding CsgD family transcriptional regulator